ncbi:MAG: efflux RND transporter periplasmic adaptor subunit, partial [Candidatus Aminicenantes bacterium]|nr:efflux RND transporter periplasmic adaptor subunit [Candidatus Aminicenantes bacterium]
MKKYIVLLTMLLLVFCRGQEGRVHDEGETPTNADLQTEVHEGDEHQDVQVSLEKQKAWGIKVGSAVMENIASRISLPGVLVMNQNETAHISSFVAGKVIALSVDLGTEVRQGQALCTINSPEFAQAQADFLETRARLNLSQKDFERAQKLFEEKALEEKEFLRREAEYNKLITEYGARGSTLHSYGLTHEHIDALISKCETVKGEEYKCEIADPNLPILSPLSGTVVFRDVILGEHVAPEKTVFTVSNLNTLWALLDAYEKDLPFISKNSAVFIESPLYPGKQFQGEITYISDLIDEQLRTVKIRVAINNSEGLLKPNMYIQGTLENTVEALNTLVIPDEAVQNLEGEKVVFVLEEEDIFTVRHVSLGLKIGSL